MKKKSIMIYPTEVYNRKAILSLACGIFNQKCIFYRACDKTSYLIYKDGSEQYLGETYMHYEDDLKVLPTDNYTYFPLSKAHLF